MSEPVRELTQEIVREVRDKTRDIAVKAIESLLTDKQGFELDDYTIEACANIVRSLGRAPLQSNGGERP